MRYQRDERLSCDCFWIRGLNNCFSLSIADLMQHRQLVNRSMVLENIKHKPRSKGKITPHPKSFLTLGNPNWKRLFEISMLTFTLFFRPFKHYAGQYGHSCPISTKRFDYKEKLRNGEGARYESFHHQSITTKNPRTY